MNIFLSRLKFRLFLVLWACGLGSQAAATVETFADQHVEMMLTHLHNRAVLRILDKVNGTPYSPDTNYAIADYQSWPSEYKYMALVPYVFHHTKAAASADYDKGWNSAGALHSLGRALILDHVVHKGLPDTYGSAEVGALGPVEIAAVANNVTAFAGGVDNTIQREADAVHLLANAGGQKILGYMLANTLKGTMPLMGYLWAGMSAVDPITGPTTKATYQAHYKKLASYFDSRLRKLELRINNTEALASWSPMGEMLSADHLNTRVVRNQAAAAKPAPARVVKAPPVPDPVVIAGQLTALAGGPADILKLNRYLLRNSFDKETEEIVQLLADFFISDVIRPTWAGADADLTPKADFNLAGLGPNEGFTKVFNATLNLQGLLQNVLRAKLADAGANVEAKYKSDTAALPGGPPDCPTQPLNGNTNYDYGRYRANMLDIRNADSARFEAQYRSYPQLMQRLSDAAMRREVREVAAVPPVPLPLADPDPQVKRKGAVLRWLGEIIEEYAGRTLVPPNPLNLGAFVAKPSAEAALPVLPVHPTPVFAITNCCDAFSKITQCVRPWAYDVVLDGRIVGVIHSERPVGLFVPQLTFPVLTAASVGTLMQTRCTTLGGEVTRVNGITTPKDKNLNAEKAKLYDFLKKLITHEAVLDDTTAGDLQARIAGLTSATHDTLIADLKAWAAKNDLFTAISITKGNISEIPQPPAKPTTPSGRVLGSRPTKNNEFKDPDVPLNVEYGHVRRRLQAVQQMLAGKARNRQQLKASERTQLIQEQKNLVTQEKVQKRVLGMTLIRINKEIQAIEKSKNKNRADVQETLRILQKRRTDLGPEGVKRSLTAQKWDLEAKIKLTKNKTELKKLEADLKNLNAKLAQLTKTSPVSKGTVRPVVKPATSKTVPPKPSVAKKKAA